MDKVASSLYLILASLVIPAGKSNVAIYSFLYFSTYFTASGLVPTKLIFPPDVKVETTFFQRKFFITEPCNYPQKIAKKRTSDFSEVLILRHFFKIHLLSALLPASYQIRPDYALYGTFQSIGMSFPYPNDMYSRSSVTLAHY